MEEYRCTGRAISMYNLVYMLITLSSVATENDYFPGLRRTKPSQGAPSQWMTNDVRDTPEFLKTINELIEERARQRFLEHWQRLQLNRNIVPRVDVAGPAFTYHNSQLNNHHNQNDPIEFAVGPNDLRFYDSIIDAYMKTKDESVAEQELTRNNPNMLLPPSPQDIKPKLPIHVNLQSLKNDEQLPDEHVLSQRVIGVVQRPVEMDEAITMYIVALIGGISAAVTVGLISIMIGWYTLHIKAKAAAEVEYPAYGVTGPNKESSHTGDSKLAQSAQIYHYQHQKQQIIAMDHSSHTDNNTDHSNAESEDDNEGDYTVYECPGLAPTGEMEVKNPLFVDDKTLHMEKNTN